MPYAKKYQPTEDENKDWNGCPGETKQSRADKEHDRYTKERSDLVKAESDSEKNFDTLLVTISSIAIAASFTLMKDVVKGTNGWIIAAWALLGVCLVGSLIDRMYTYRCHKKWRDRLDDVFNNYDLHCGHAWKEADARLQDLRAEKVWYVFPAEKFLDRIKFINAGGLIFGLIALMIYVYVGSAPQAPAAAPQPVIVNVYNSATQPVAN
jgi:hypothetical protein